MFSKHPKFQNKNVDTQPKTSRKGNDVPFPFKIAFE
jgi:hypothetical protein